MSNILIKIYRGNLVENIYRGDIAINDGKSQIVCKVGDNQKITYWRSAAKPIQVLPVIYSGASEKFNLTDQEIAIMTSSHNGEKKHITLVRSILDKIHLKETHLLCGACLPTHKPTAQCLYQDGIKKNPIYNPCSGKHAAQLALCQYYGWPIDDYSQFKHPVQKMILNMVAELTGYPKEKIVLGIDDCGVPVFGLPIQNMSIAYSRMVHWDSLPISYRLSAKHVFSSMIKYPELVGGTDRFDTDLMKVSEGILLAKSGAAGVFCIGVRDEDKKNIMGITIKMESGNMKFIPMVALRVLDQLKIISKDKINKLKKYCFLEVRNQKKEKVGQFITDFKLNGAKNTLPQF